MRSVRARAALGATLVVAVALTVAGLAVLLVLRGNLTDRAGLEAEVTAREVAGELALGKAYAELEASDDDSHPVQVTDEEGRVVAVSKDLEAISGTGASQVVPASPAPVPSPGDEDDDDDDDGTAPPRSEVSSDPPDFTNGTATVDGETADYRFATVEVTTQKDVT